MEGVVRQRRRQGGVCSVGEVGMQVCREGGMKGGR